MGFQLGTPAEVRNEMARGHRRLQDGLPLLEVDLFAIEEEGAGHGSGLHACKVGFGIGTAGEHPGFFQGIFKTPDK